MSSSILGASEVADATLTRKPSSEFFKYPYSKPTQVDEERILRRSRECSLRNSAKWLRNFGIRGPLLCEGHTSGARRGRRNRPKRLFIKNTGLC